MEFHLAIPSVNGVESGMDYKVAVKTWYAILLIDFS